MLVANAIVQAVRELHLDMKGLSLGQLGVSIGVTTYPDLNASTQDLVKAADTALYQAQDNGRSQAIHTNQSNEDAKRVEPEVEQESEGEEPNSLVPST